MGVQIPKAEITKLSNRFMATPQKLRDVAFYMIQLVEDRFRSQGQSGGKRWPDKQMKKWGYDDGRAVLTGPTALLRKSFVPIATDKVAGTGSWAPHSVVHQLGCISKGGVLPDIRPKRAKALFIPITDKAIKSVRLVGTDASAVRLLHKIASTADRMIGPYRAGVKESRKNKTSTFVPLIKGRLYKGKLQAWDEKKGEWVDNKTPDFIFLKKVSVPPRPMLPDSPVELRKITGFYVHKLMSEANG